MSLKDVFSALLMDHARHPRNYGRLPDPDLVMEGANPACGDEITLQVKLAEDKVKSAAFTGKSCAICTASSSLFCERAADAPLAELDKLKSLVYKMLHGEELTAEEKKDLGEYLALEGVGKLSSRVKCATLVWETWALMEKELQKRAAAAGKA